MCILPAFCSNATSCYNTTFATCDECSFAAFFAFGFFVTLLGLTIVATNSLVLWQVVRKNKKGTFDKIKASLAVADILSGFQPLVISPYNLHWTINSTANEFTRKCSELYGSPQAIAAGIFYLVGVSSSVYHLVFLSQQRVFAMRWPLKYRMQEARTVYIGLGIIWVLAILAAVVPACFPDEITFFYHADSFVFVFGLRKITNIVVIHIVWILPVLVMISLMIYSAILIRRNIRRSKRLSGNNSDQEVHNKREASMFKTVALMQVGFTVTLVPFGFFLLPYFLTVSQWCGRLGIAKIVCYYLVMTNSLVNPIVYSYRDKEFRKSIFQCYQRR